MVDLEKVQHADDVGRDIPGIARHPAIDGEQAARVTVVVHRDGDEVRQRLVALRPGLGAGVRHRRDAGGHAGRAQEGVEVAVLAFGAAVGMVVVLGVAVGIEDVVRGIVVEFDELALPAQDFADDVEAALFQHAIALADFVAGPAHVFEPCAGKTGRKAVARHGFAAPSCSD